MNILDYLCVFRAEGKDAGSFLHAQTSADLAALPEGAARFAAYCSPKGQVIAPLLFGRTRAGWWIVGQSVLLPAVVQRLQRYRLRADVTLQPMPGLRVTGLRTGESGSGAAELLEPGEAPLRYALLADSQQIAGTGDDWRRHELLHGLSWLSPATSERFIPQMLGLDRLGAVSFGKGCYPGQEVIARTRYLGQVKRQPVLLAVRNCPAPQAGTACAIQATGRTGEILADAVVVDVAGLGPADLALLAVAALEDDAQVHTLQLGTKGWPAERLAWAAR